MTNLATLLLATLLENGPTVNANAPMTLLVKQAGSATAEALERGLRAAGVTLRVLASPYDTVTEAARRGAGVQHLVVGVDFFDAETFRLVPLFRREWPRTTIVAYHSPGFEHKGRIAGLVGADVVLSRPEELLDFLRTLSRPAEPAAETRSQAGPAAEAPEAPPPARSPLPEQEAAPSEVPPPEPETAAQDKTPPAPAAAEIENLDGGEERARGRVLDTVELTDDELRILLGEDDET